MRAAATGNTAARRAAITVSVWNDGPGRDRGIGWGSGKGHQEAVGTVPGNAAHLLHFINFTIQTLIIPLKGWMQEA